jgi:hypothetical protein
MQRQFVEDKKEEVEQRQNEEVILGSDGKPFFCNSSYLEYLATQPR